ncbi:MAG: hypothetical protein ACFBZ8_01055 [Opitutales bacterium]
MKRFPLCNALRVLAVCLLTGLVGGLSLAPLPAAAQSSAEARSELLGRAMEARLQGDFAQANSLLEELIRLDPGNTAVQTLFEKNKTDLERSQSGQPTVLGQAPDVGGPSTGGVQASDSSIEGLLNRATSVVADAEAAAEQALEDAEQLAEAEQFAAAGNVLRGALVNIPASPGTTDVREELIDMLGDVSEAQIVMALESNDPGAADLVLADYVQVAGNDDFSRDARAAIRGHRNNPFNYGLEDLAPEFAARQARVEQALVEGRARYLMGDLVGARSDFNLASKLDPNNVEAKAFLVRIAEDLADASYNDRVRTREELLEAVNKGWTPPGIYTRQEGPGDAEEVGIIRQVREQLANTLIPFVRFTDVPLDRAMETLAEASTRYSPITDEQGNRLGLNIVLFARGRPIPNVSVTLNQQESLDTILELVTSTVEWEYTIGGDGVIRVQPAAGGSGAGGRLRTEFYDITAQMLIRMGVDTGTGGGGGGGGGVFDPFAAGGGGGDPFGGSGGGGDQNAQRGEQIRTFFENAGVDFQGTTGARLAFTGNQIIVTHSAQAHEQIRDILRRFVTIEMVEIESKFIEVEEGVLEELGFNWNVNNGANNVYRTFDGPSVVSEGSDIAGLPTPVGNIRSLSSAFATASSTLGNGNVTQTTFDTATVFDPVTGIASTNTTSVTDNTPIINQAPTFPGALNLAADTISSANVFGVVDDWNVNLVITALEQQAGTDLMSAPRLTVLSGKTAEIVVAQELRYPESYGDIEAEVSQAGGGTLLGGGGTSVAITAGTPQDFTTRRIGVEMNVQPQVEGGDRISLRIEPTVTEFEGFVEYGGQSIAISGTTTVTVPSGFFQPIFSVRQIRTEVTIFDGATVIMGGLTREEVSRVEDKVPILGDIPGLGRLFRSEGESSLKTNLMIFVTARLISPGGAPLNEDTEVRNQVFKPSTILTPGGPITRTLDLGGSSGE